MATVHIVPKFNAPGPSEFQASFWMDIQPTPVLADAAEIQANVTDWLQDMYDTIASSVRTVITATEYAIYIHDLLTGLDSHFVDGGWTFAGTSTLDSQAPQVSPTISAKVLTRDRPAQKRMIPFSDGQISEGIMTAGALTTMLAFGTQWVSARPVSTNYTYEPGLVSVGAPGQFNPFTGVINASTVAGTVRSRKRGVGI